MGGSGVSKSQVSRLVEEIDDRVKAFLDRPTEGDWPYLWLDATYVKVRQAGRIVSVAAIIAVGDWTVFPGPQLPPCCNTLARTHCVRHMVNVKVAMEKALAPDGDDDD